MTLILLTTYNLQVLEQTAVDYHMHVFVNIPPVIQLSISSTMPPRSSTEREDSSIRDSSVLDHSGASYETGASKGENPAVGPTRNERKVTFAATAKVRQFTKVTNDQAKDVWFTNEDFHRMKASFAHTLQRLAVGALTADDEQGEQHCSRGLEYRTREGARRRLRNKHEGMAAVLHEQDRQSFEEKRDPEKLAQVYMDVNCKCSFEALALGRRDEADIQEYIAAASEPSVNDEKENSAARMISSLASKRVAKLKHSGSFHERSIRGLKRIFSGPKKFRRNVQVDTVAVAVA
jgi:hypothetical protein